MTTLSTLAGAPSRRGPRGRPLSWLEVLLFLTGGGCLATMVLRIGAAPILEALVRLGSSLWLIVVIELVAVTPGVTRGGRDGPSWGAVVNAMGARSGSGRSDRHGS